jgi:CheY-like chemotaxis protein
MSPRSLATFVLPLYRTADGLAFAPDVDRASEATHGLAIYSYWYRSGRAYGKINLDSFHLLDFIVCYVRLFHSGTISWYEVIAMLNIEAQEIPFSFDQPDAVLRPLLTILQQAFGEPGARAAGEKLLLSSRQVLIIDAHKERGNYLVMLLEAAGYRSLAVMTALEAFTLFLRGAFVPLAIILGQEDPANRLFLQRLLQQVGQKYTRDVPLIRLRSQPPRTTPLTTSPLVLPSPRSEPLPTIPQTPPPPSLPRGKAPPVSSPQTPAPRPPAARAPAKIRLTPQTPLPLPAPKVTSPLWQQEGAVKKERAPAPRVEKKSLEGHEMGRYRVVSLIGEGTFGATYRAYDRLREQDIALKAASTNSVPYLMMEGAMEEVSLFQQEKDLIGGLEHPHIIPVLHYGRSYVSGSPFIYKTMRYCTEGSLGDWLRAHGGQRAFSLQEAAHIILQVGETLQFLHDHDITYQNFKLSNLLISAPAEDLDRLELLLTDFAIPQDGSFFPTSVEAFAYLAPERWNGEASPASDQYGLAVLAYELLTGRPPFQGTTEQIMRRLHTQMQPQPPSAFNPALPGVIDNVLLRALAKKPGDRFASISLFIRPFQFYRPS